MLDDVRRARIREKRETEVEGRLTPEEAREAYAPVLGSEGEEARYPRPATQRLEEEVRRVEAKNPELRKLLDREKRLLRRLDRALATAKAGQAAIDEEKVRILSSD